MLNYHRAYFNYPIEIIQQFLEKKDENDSSISNVQFLFLKEKRIEGSNFVEYCLLTKKGRFMRLLDHVNSSVDIREAAQYIDSIEAENEELETIWDGQISNKQFYLILDYCPPLFCGSNCELI